MSKELEKELIEIKEELKGIYGLEITTTEACNFQCSYCFERNHLPEKILLTSEILIPKIKELLNAEWFKEQYSGMKIILWGGEPTMNMSLCISLINAFMYDKRICFFIYTNGSTIDEIMPTLIKLKKQSFIKKNQSKVTVQVSYDGNPLHDMNRLSKLNGIPTSKLVQHGIRKLHKNGIDFGLKATISWKDFRYLPEAWDDFNWLYSLFGKKIKYALTVDYYNVQCSKYYKDVESSLINIAQKEVKFYKKHGHFLSNIFKNNKAICATGKSMAVINTNGDILNCHGSIYSNCSKDLTYANISDENFINSIKKTNSLYENNYIEPDECKECIATSCLRCNVKKYEESKKETHLDRWFDYPAQPDLCKYYKTVGKISAAIGLIIKE